MVATIAITVISFAGIAFLLRFLIALRNEDRGGACHILYILPGAAQRDGESLLSDGERRDIAHAKSATAMRRSYVASR